MSIAELKPAPDARLVESLERLLAEAREGHLLGMAAVTFRAGAYDIESWGCVSRGDLALASLELQQAAMR